jgi:hypothetical protein
MVYGLEISNLSVSRKSILSFRGSLIVCLPKVSSQKKRKRNKKQEKKKNGKDLLE